MKKVTVKDLIDSGILKDYFEKIKINQKQASSSPLIKIYLTNILHNFIWLKKIKVFKDPSRDYLKKLERDFKKLDKTETHKFYIQPIKNIIAVEIKVAKKYISLYRQKGHKEYAKDFIFLTLNDFLKDLKYQKRIEIISDLYLFLSNPPDCCNRWKERHPDYYYKEEGNVRKRLQRIKNISFKELKGKEYRKYEKKRLEQFGEQIKKSASEKREVPGKVYNKKQLRKYIRSQATQSQIQKWFKEKRSNFDGFNLLNLMPILHDLKVPQMHRSQLATAISDDLEFLSAFKSPQSPF